MLQRTRAWLIYAGLTLPLGLLGHMLFELFGGVSRRAESIGVAHTALLAASAIAIAITVAVVRRGTSGDRRIRMTLLRRALPSGGRLALAGAALQALVSIATLAAEGVTVDPDHVGFAVVVGLIAVLIGSVAFSAARDSILAFAAALVGDSSSTQTPPRFEHDSPALARYLSCTVRLRAGRGPPSRAFTGALR
jgi:hypothetical protein